MGQLTEINRNRAGVTYLTILLILIVLVLSIARGHLIGTLVLPDKGAGDTSGIEDLNTGNDRGLGTPPVSEGAAPPLRATAASLNL